MQTLKEYLKSLATSLSQIYDLSEAKSIAKYYLTETLNLSNTELMIKREEPLSSSELKKLKKNESRLLSGEPIQYITGKAHFYDLCFFVDKSVLIPRQETEILVDSIIREYSDKKDLRILDIGTGSGCIAISLKKNMPQASVFALDISKKALSVCKKNIKINKVELVCLEFDILSDKEFPILEDFDLIVSNPPYVLNSEKMQMHNNVVKYEPELALYVDDSDPLVYYQKISKFAKSRLKKNGSLYFEINEKYAQEIIEINSFNNFENQFIIKDLNGKDRFIVAELR